MINYIKKRFFVKNLSETETNQLVLEKIGHQIYTGPFAGLKIPTIVQKEFKLAESLGLYEFALHKVISTLPSRKIDNIMVIGGHKGYYPAGLSNFLRPENMYVFEMDEKFFPLLESWISLNNLKPYKFYQEATAEILEKWIEKIDFLLIDCEGAEDFLLLPDQYPWQKNTDILVEVHHFYDNKIMGNLISRFKNTHQLEIIYDDIVENHIIDTILKELGIKGNYRKQPLHRWIFNENKSKIITSGVFLYMKANSKS